MFYRVDQPNGEFVIIESEMPIQGAVEVTHPKTQEILDAHGVLGLQRDAEYGVKPLKVLPKVEHPESIEDRLSKLTAELESIRTVLGK